MEQIQPLEIENNKNKLFVVKISGPDTAFIDDIVSTLKNSYMVLYVSKLKPNSDGEGQHLFVDIVRNNAETQQKEPKLRVWGG